MEKKKKILKIVQVVYDILSFGFILFMIIALCVGNKQNVKQNQKQVINVNNEVSEVVDVKNRQLITYDDTIYSVVYSVDDNTYDNWISIAQLLVENGYGDSNPILLSNSSVIFDSNPTTLTSIDCVKSGDFYYLNLNHSGGHYENTISLNTQTSAWRYQGRDLVFGGLTIVNETYYNLVAPQPPVLVDELFTAVTDTAVAFTDTLTDSVDAVGDMFWDSANNRITPLASLILIVIGVGLVYWSFRLIFRLIRRA